MASNADRGGQPEQIDRCRLILSLGGMLLFFVLGMFLLAGTWKWTRGWLFILVIVVAAIVSTLYLRRVNPEVIAGRVNRHKGTKRWDLILGVMSAYRPSWRSRLWQPWTMVGTTGSPCRGGAACWALPC